MDNEIGPGERCKTCDIGNHLACANIGLTIMTLCRYAPGASDAVTIVRGVFCSRVIEHDNRLAYLMDGMAVK